MSVQRIPDRLVAVNITAGETFSWKRNGVDIFSVSDITPITFSSVENFSPFRLAPSAKPTAVFQGDLWVSSSTGLPRIYDSRNKFLSADRSVFNFKREQSGPIRLSVNLSPEKRNLSAITLVGYRAERNLSVDTLNLAVFVDNVNVLSITLANTELVVSSEATNIDISAGSLIEVRALASPSNTSNQVYVDLYYRENE